MKHLFRGCTVVLALAVPLVAIFGAVAEAENLPVPPIPPLHAPFGEIAPIPNPDLNAPIGLTSEQVRLDVKLYRATPYDTGLGFAPGSRYRSSEDRKPIQTPGLIISVPIQ